MTSSHDMKSIQSFFCLDSLGQKEENHETKMLFGKLVDDRAKVLRSVDQWKKGQTNRKQPKNTEKPRLLFPCVHCSYSTQSPKHSASEDDHSHGKEGKGSLPMSPDNSIAITDLTLAQ